MLSKRLITLKILITLFLASGTCLSTAAQTAESKAPQQLTVAGVQAAAAKEAALLKRKLTLSDDQEKQLQVVVATFYESVLGLASTADKRRGEEILALETQKETAIKRLLTSEQYKLYSAGNANARQQSARNQQLATEKMKASKKN